MSAPPAADAANLYEVFSSVQGEATHVGERHLFVRMAGCDLECLFCDTPASRRIPPRCRLHLPGGVEEIANPVPAGTLDEAVSRLDAEAGPHHAVALTGGEPLLFVDYLLPLARGWRARGRRILLETGGHRPRELERMLEHTDIVMADVKIASSAGFATDLAVAAEFLRLSAQRECAVGKVDTTVPFATSEAFAKKMKAAGNRCELVAFEDQGHGFFNYGRGDNRCFRETLTQADQFLASLGYLRGLPQVDEFLKP